MTPDRPETPPRPEIVEWHWLRPHLERDALILAAPELDLGAAAERIAADDTQTVASWITTGRLAKPSLEQITAWNADPAKRFHLLIVQPWVLIREWNEEGD